MIDLPVLTKSDAEASAEDNVRLWRSIEHLEQQQTYEAEHKAEFTEEAMAPATSSDRRDFLKVMAASMAMAGLTACRRPVERILPYSRKPEEVIPGIPMYYASAMPHAGVLHPVVVTSYEGRPQKIEGNPEHPMRASGASNVFQQATMLNMYDPDRSGVVIRDGELQDWDAFLSFVRGYQPSGTMAVLAPTVSSPTIARLRAEMERQFPGTMWVNWDAAGADNRSMGNQIAFGQPYRTVHRFSRAEVILALESDFLDGANPNSLWEGSEYSESRRIVTPEDSMSRLYMVESAYSLTGGMADHRLRLRPSQIGAFAAALAARLGVAEATPAAQQFAEHPWVDVLAEDLQSARGRSVVVAGGSQPAVVHALVARINDMLGNIGQTVELIDTGQAELTDQDEALGELVASMNGGSIETLLMLGTNPVYAAPASLNFRGAMERVANTIHAGLWADETASVSNWHLPLAHFVEAWGDGRSYDGTRSVIQPLISPLYDDAHSEIEILAAFLGINKSGYEIVRETWSSVIDGDFEKAWRLTLHDGFQAGTQYPVVTA
ncbi:MAG: TAT-variant-translocated molybdopterin oxidoreductase, partial [Bacteroidota bacterium]